MRVKKTNHEGEDAMKMRDYNLTACLVLASRVIGTQRAYAVAIEWLLAARRRRMREGGRK